jgi:hypothetical protein
MSKVLFSGLLLFAILGSTTAVAQTKSTTLSGKVISFEESLGLEGVLIQVKGTKKTSGTQSDGTYSIIVTPEDKILEFILEGYQTQELVLPSGKGYDIILKRNGNSIKVCFVVVVPEK